MTDHNHVTRDIKPRGQCPGCDRYWDGVQIPGPLPPREDNYETDDPEPWERFDGKRTAHTGVNLYGSGFRFNPRPEVPQVVDRHAPKVQTHGKYTFTVYDDQPIKEGDVVAAWVRFTLAVNGEVIEDDIYPAYRQYTLLAHWKDGLSPE